MAENINLDDKLGCLDRVICDPNNGRDNNVGVPTPPYQCQEDDSTAQKADILCLGHIASRAKGIKLLLERKPDFCSLLTKACIFAGDISIRSACMDAIR